MINHKNCRTKTHLLGAIGISEGVSLFKDLLHLQCYLMIQNYPL